MLIIILSEKWGKWQDERKKKNGSFVLFWFLIRVPTHLGFIPQALTDQVTWQTPSPNVMLGFKPLACDNH